MSGKALGPLAMQIVSEVGKAADVSKAQILGNSRMQATTRARHVAIFLIHDRLGLSVAEIARAFNRDHSTAAYAINRVQRGLGVDKHLTRLAAAAESALGVS